VIPPNSAIVLAGGKGSRLGQDKRYLRLSSTGSQLVETIQRVSEVADDVVVAVARDPDEVKQELALTNARARVVQDVELNAGPLAGLCAALDVVEHDIALVVACDLPLLNVAVLRGLLGRPRDYDLLVPRRADGTLEMLHAVYRRACLDTLRECLAAGRLKLHRAVDDLLAAGRVVRFVDEDEIARDDPSLLTFFNVNTPADLDRARALLASRLSS
jgi:molybdenum cofactor guanylyltransferase